MQEAFAKMGLGLFHFLAEVRLARECMEILGFQVHQLRKHLPTKKRNDLSQHSLNLIGLANA